MCLDVASFDLQIVSAENLVGYSEAAKCQAIAKVFDDAYKVRHCATSRLQAAAYTYEAVCPPRCWILGCLCCYHPAIHR